MPLTRKNRNYDLNPHSLVTFAKVNISHNIHIMSIHDNLKKVFKSITNPEITLVAVSKTKPLNDIMEVYDAGHRHFGENKVQELIDKHEKLPKDIKWHMIGHLQRNKVKYIIPFVHLIHGVDSLRLLRQIDSESKKRRLVTSCLLQVHIAEEETKFGFSLNEIYEIFESEDLKPLKNIQILGLMGMATNTTDESQIRSEFASLHEVFMDIQKRNLPDNVHMQALSMGMSGDYRLAIDNGSNMIRVGSAIFGKRNYDKND